MKRMAWLKPGEQILLTPHAAEAARKRDAERRRREERERRRRLPLRQQTAADRPVVFAALLAWPFVVAILVRVFA